MTPTGIMILVISSVVAIVLAWWIWVSLKNKKVWMIVCYVLLALGFAFIVYVAIFECIGLLGECRCQEPIIII